MSKTKTKLGFVRILSKFIKIFRGLFRLPTKNFIIQRNEIAWKIDLDEAIDVCLYVEGVYEKELKAVYDKIVTEGQTVVDIGANFGGHTLPLAELVGASGKVHALEATNFAVQKLKTNAGLNLHLNSRIDIQHIFLTDTVAKIPAEVSSSWNISKSLNDPSRNSLDGGFAQSIKGAKIQTLDEWAEENNIQKIDLIKLDVDGGEIEVLAGGMQTLKKHKPTLLIELSPIHFEHEPERFNQQVSLIREAQYEIEDVFGEKVPLDAEYLRKWIPYGSLVNVVGRIK